MYILPTSPVNRMAPEAVSPAVAHERVTLKIGPGVGEGMPSGITVNADDPGDIGRG